MRGLLREKETHAVTAAAQLILERGERDTRRIFGCIERHIDLLVTYFFSVGRRLQESHLCFDDSGPMTCNIVFSCRSNTSTLFEMSTKRTLVTFEPSLFLLHHSGLYLFYSIEKYILKWWSKFQATIQMTDLKIVSNIQKIWLKTETVLTNL